MLDLYLLHPLNSLFVLMPVMDVGHVSVLVLGAGMLVFVGVSHICTCHGRGTHHGVCLCSWTTGIWI